MQLSTPIEEIPRIGPQYQKRLKRMGIKTIRDLLSHFPHRYEDFSNIIPIAQADAGGPFSFQGKILEIRNLRTFRKKMIITQATLGDESGKIKVIWFNQPYLINTLKKDEFVCLAGKVTKKNSSKYLSNPAYEKIYPKSNIQRGPNESLGGWREGWSPLYNFAVVIDDFEMKISHVIRGEDHIPNTQKQILLQEALGFPRPKYCHLPLILGPDRTKLSKRHGAVAISAYREQGYLAETLVNFMAFLGWNPGTEREIYSMPSLIKEFSLEKVQKGGAVFNIKRLDFLNGFYIRSKSPEKLTELCLPYLIEKGLITPTFKTEQYPPAYGGMEIKQNYQISETGEKISLDFIQKIVSIYQERLKKLSEISELTDFFFKEKLVVDEAKASSPPFANARVYDKNLLRWGEMTDREIMKSLDKLEGILSKIKVGDWTKENLEKILMPEADNFAKQIGKIGDRGYLLWPLRVALTGKDASAGPFEIADILGKEKTIKRIKRGRGLI